MVSPSKNSGEGWTHAEFLTKISFSMSFWYLSKKKIRKFLFLRQDITLHKEISKIPYEEGQRIERDTNGAMPMFISMQKKI